MDKLIQPVQSGQAVVDEMSAQLRLEPHQVERLGVGYPDLRARRIDGQVK